jgi:hypothetical protein
MAGPANPGSQLRLPLRQTHVTRDINDGSLHRAGRWLQRKIFAMTLV